MQANLISNEKEKGAIAGAISGAEHIHKVAELYRRSCDYSY